MNQGSRRPKRQGSKPAQRLPARRPNQPQQTSPETEDAVLDAPGTDQRQLLAMSARFAGNAATAALSRQLRAGNLQITNTMGGQVVDRFYAGQASSQAAIMREKIAHKTGKEVDTLASADAFLKTYVAEKIKGGTKAEGHVNIYAADEFKKKTVAYLMAHENEATGKTYTKAEAEAFEPSINAYQDAGAIVIHEERGNPGTAIHESMHLYQNDTFLDTLGFNANEGTTEYFTRTITSDLKIVRSNYEEQYSSVNKLVGATSKDNLAEGYFNGKLKGLEDAVEGKAKGAWASWKDFIKKGKYSDADALLK